MKIGANNLYAEMQAMALQAGSPIRSEIAPALPKVENPSSSQFGQLLESALGNVNKLGQDSKDMIERFEFGDKNISLADVMIAKEKASVAFEATVQVRNKVIEAYEKIINMPV